MDSTQITDSQIVIRQRSSRATPKDRLALYKTLLNSKVNLLSWFDKDVDFTKIKDSVEKGSASASLAIFAVLKNKPGLKLFVKMSFGEAKDGLYYERLIYENVATPLIDRHITPCVVPMIAYIRVDNRYNKCDKKGRKTTKTKEVCDAIGRSNFQASTLVHGHALITEGTLGTTLSQWVKKFDDNDCATNDDMMQIMFQLIYTLQCFAEIKLLHNDLHSGNVFVEPNREYKELYFVVSSKKMVAMRPRYILKIYDFDRSTKLESDITGFTRPIENKWLYEKMSYVYGAKPTWDPRIDIIRVLGSIYSRLPSRWKSFVGEIMRPQMIDAMYESRKIAYVDTMCYIDPKKPRYSACVVKPRTTARYAMSPKQVLDSNLFSGIYTSPGHFSNLNPENVFYLPSVATFTRNKLLSGQFKRSGKYDSKSTSKP